MPWSDIEQALDGKRGEAIIAGTAISAAKRDLYGLSYTYFRFPARFIAKSDVQLPTDLTFYDQLNGKTVGVIAKSAHEAMLIDGFPNTKPTPFADVKQVYDALKSGEIELAFVDGVASSFWLSSSNAANCCTFVGDPYYSQKYLGLGMAVVTRKEDTELLQAINAALKSIEETGRYQEIYERYLPNSPH
ncbi:putative ABC transporter arginine-binding protein 2 [Nymphon striatum]|nr:putative ABC transporter arginine-binding protein 2 [Nymphon striatum]